MAFDFDNITALDPTIIGNVYSLSHIKNICDKIFMSYHMVLKEQNEITPNEYYGNNINIWYINFDYDYDVHSYNIHSICEYFPEIFHKLYLACPYIFNIISFRLDPATKYVLNKGSLFFSLFKNKDLTNYYADYRISNIYAYRAKFFIYDTTKDKTPFGMPDNYKLYYDSLYIQYFNVNIKKILLYIKFISDIFKNTQYKLHFELYGLFDKIDNISLHSQIKDLTKSEILYLCNTILSFPQYFERIHVSNYNTFVELIYNSIKNRYKYTPILNCDNDIEDIELPEIVRILYNELYTVYYKNIKSNKNTKITKIIDNVPIMGAYVLDI